MARARNIKPGLYKNEDLAECSVWTRYIFPGLWMMADRDGRLEDRPKRIKGELLPYDTQEVEPLLAELAAKKDAQGVPFIVRYQNNQGRFIQISKFATHQTPHYSEKQSIIKPPSLQEKTVDDGCETLREGQERSENDAALKGGSQPPDSLIPDSLIPDSPKRAERKRSTRPQKTGLPDGFSISERVIDWAASKGFGNLEAHFEGFIGKAKAKGYTYADWDEALMTAVRDDWAGIRKNGFGGTQQQQPSATMRAVIALENMKGGGNA